MIKETRKKTSTQFLSILIVVAIFINICLLYAIAYKSGIIYSNHISEMAFAFKKQTTYDEVLFGIVNSISDKTQDNTSAIRNHAEIMNQHADIINDHINVLTNHADVQNAQTTTIKNQQKRLKRLEAIIDILQESIQRNGLVLMFPPLPETET